MTPYTKANNGLTRALLADVLSQVQAECCRGGRSFTRKALRAVVDTRRAGSRHAPEFTVQVRLCPHRLTTDGRAGLQWTGRALNVNEARARAWRAWLVKRVAPLKAELLATLAKG